MIDLSKYSIFATSDTDNQTNIVHNQKEDYEAIESFNKYVSEVLQKYFILAYILARKTMTTD